MNLENNIYITSLEIGANKLEEGISFNDLLMQLKKKNIEVPESLKESFHYWFYNVFYQPNIDSRLRAISTTSRTLQESEFKEYDKHKAFLKGESYFKLLEYFELKEARQSSKRAQWTAIIAIVISGLFALIQILQ